MALETSAEAPVPVRTVLQLVGGWVQRLGRIWVDGEIAELARRGGTVFVTLRDPAAAVSVRVICTRTVFDSPAHPYSRGLLDAFPSIRGPKVPLTGIPGNPPALVPEARQVRDLSRPTETPQLRDTAVAVIL